MRDDAERSQCGQRIGDDVIEKCAETLLRVGHDGEQHVAGMGDGGVSQQASHAALNDGDQVSQHHGERGDDGEHRDPARREVQPGGAAFRAGKADGQHLEEDEEAGDLGTGGDERGAGCGRALVDIRRPEMERERRRP